MAMFHSVDIFEEQLPSVRQTKPGRFPLSTATNPI
jgi:hypothetical protein